MAIVDLMRAMNSYPKELGSGRSSGSYSGVAGGY